MSKFNQPLNKLVQLSPLALAVTTALTVTQAHAKEYKVTSTAKTGSGSLNKAMQDASGTSANDTIVFDSSLSGKTVTLNEVYFSEGSGNLTIDGSGAPDMTINAVIEDDGWAAIAAREIDLKLKDVSITVNNKIIENNVGFFIDAKYSASVALENVVIQDKSKKGQERYTFIIASRNSEVLLNNTMIEGTGDFDSRTLAIAGGDNEVEINHSILTKNFAVVDLWADYGSTLSINNSFITNNGTENEGDTEGGGVVVEGEATASLSIRNTTIANNKGSWEVVGAYAEDALEVEIVNTVISNNSVSNDSVVYLEAEGVADITIAHSTIVNNTSGKYIEGEGIGVWGESALYVYGHEGTELNISNNIITGNTAWSYDEDKETWFEEKADVYMDGDVGDFTITAKSNLIGKDWSEAFKKKNGNILGEDPLLKEGLFERKDAIPTVCLEKDSPARNSADITITEKLKLGLDQLGRNRLADGKPDMGATEFASCNKKKGGGGSMGSALIALLALAGFRRSKSKLAK